ncbi:hypothetical protein ONS95_000472 [Cadophora gregata]|uniref:uncharacterized protein n=1 Tax=Cadophora gregata TaxID=51156 RepID=UPI0026DB4993|nr:uncharacterized protein ONS95_000472 [Cadophora gregata]KAK0128500.1 hypothetical protein ONS95_000472 [Cadophora gregata]
MEKIKNILKPGKSHDDEALYGAEQSTKHTGGLTGEGSHLGGTTNPSSTTNPISTSGQHNTGVGNTSTGLGSQNVTSGSALGNTSGQTSQLGQQSGQGSHLASATSGGPTHTSGVTTTTTTQTHTGQSHAGQFHADQSHAGRDAGLAGATAGGIGLAHDSHGQQSGHGAYGTTSGPHTSDLANRADPRVDSDNSRYPTQSNPQTNTPQGGLGNAQIGGGSSSIGQSALSSLTGGSTGSAEQSGPTQSGSTPRHIPGEWIDETDTSRYAGTGASDTNTGAGSHLGRDTAALGTAGAVGSGIHSQRDTDRGLASTTGSSNLAHGSQTGHGVDYAGSQQGTSNSADNHLGRDAALIGGAGAVGTGIHSHQDRTRDSAYTGPGYTGSGQTTTQHASGSHGPHSTDTANLLDPSVNTRGTSGYEDAHHHSPTQGGGAEEADHHHGRNTAIGAGIGSAAAVGVAHQYGQHQHDRGTGVGATGGSGVGHSAGLESTQGTGLGASTGVSQSSTGPAPHTVGPHSKDWQNVADPRINPNNAAEQASQAQTGTHPTSDSSGHHYGREAAIGAGAVGAGGLAGSQYQRHQAGTDAGASNPTGAHQTSSGLTSGPAPNTAGPHSSDMLNKLDPRITANPTVAQGNPQAQSVLSQSDKSHAATGGYAAQPSSSNQKDYNYGRDAGLAGGATSAFVGHHQGESTDPGRVHGTSATSQDPYSSQRSTLDPTADRSKDHHYGRDAAITGGAGTAAYAAGRHHNQGESADSSRAHGASTASQDPYSTSSTQRSTVDPTTDRSKDHHYGRDATVAGGAAGIGGATYEADKHSREKELAKAQREAEKDHKHDVKHAEKDDKHHEKKKGGFLSFLHRDKSKKYSAEEEAEFDRQEREHHASQSHTGRNAALGGAAVAGAGAGAYAAGQHHDADTNKSLPTAPGNHGIGTGEGTQNALAGAGHTSGIHHDDQTHGTPLPLKPAGKDIGDMLHGVERNRGVTGATGFPDQPGFGDGTTGHQHSVSEATTDRDGRPIGSGTTGAGYGSQQTGREFPLGRSKHDSEYTDKNAPIHTTSHGQSDHHTTRNAAALGGAGLVGEHEYRKHDTATGHQSGLTGSQGQSGLSGNQLSSGYQSVLDPGHQTGTSTGQQDYRQHGNTSGYQTGHNTTGLGSSGQQDYRQHDTTSAYQPGRETSGLGSTGQQDYRQPGMSSGYQTGHETSGQGSSGYHHDTNTGSSGLTGSKTSDLSGRNRLHKDPPSSHPAAQAYSGGDDKGAHVPASGAERERLLQQGKSDLDRDTGVANAPGNSSTNY